MIDFHRYIHIAIHVIQDREREKTMRGASNRLKKRGNQLGEGQPSDNHGELEVEIKRKAGAIGL